jgi:Type I phosphodiesterase / nucleotide pyrophosphatase
MRRGVLCIVVLLLVLAGPGQAAPRADAGLDKVLVIGTDGTRWDLVEQAMRTGKAPNLKRLRASGFGRPSLLRYQPSTYTLSEVGWSTIASGVWETKHGVDGHLLNMDPGQATKNGYLDFLTRVERLRPSLNTYLASDWDNIGLPLNGGPIFGSAMDVNFAARVPAETIDNWNAGDAAVTKAAEGYLRNRDPDAAFVYLGLVDETAHLAGSATPTYASAIATTDKRIGRILRAVRARPTYPFESWTILVTTDHGQKPLSEPSVVSHFGHTKLELTSFVFGSGPGLTARVKKPLVVDVNPTVLHQLGLPVKRAWNLDGHTLSKAKPPSSASAKLRGHRLTVRLKLGSHPKARNVSVRLPARVEKLVGGSVNGAAGGWTSAGSTVVLGVPGGRLHTLSLSADVAGRGRGSVVVTLRGGKLTIPVR